MKFITELGKQCYIFVVGLIVCILLCNRNLAYTSYGVGLAPASQSISKEKNAPLAIPTESQNNIYLSEESSGIFREDEKGILHVVFYNIFIPSKKNMMKHIENIITEQIKELSTSYASKLQHEAEKMLKVYYKTIGHSELLSYRFIEQICQEHSLECINLGHYPVGHEEITLSSLHGFCTKVSLNVESKKEEKQKTWVIYIHTKGSYHASQVNEMWRKYMTKAVLSNGCLIDAPKNSCSTCGLLFMPIWSNFYPGNMWTANCAYISKLLDPYNFSSQMNYLKDRALKLNKEGKFTMELYNIKRNDYFGIDRYSNEHWIGSHPDLIPCDVSQTANLNIWLKKTVTNRSFDFSRAPRHSIQQPWLDLDEYKLKHLLHNKNGLNKEYFLLPGLMWRHWELYKTFPSQSSWVWDWYPGGNEWKNIISNISSNANIYEESLFNWSKTRFS